MLQWMLLFHPWHLDTHGPSVLQHPLIHWPSGGITWSSFLLSKVYFLKEVLLSGHPKFLACITCLSLCCEQDFTFMISYSDLLSSSCKKSIPWSNWLDGILRSLKSMEVTLICSAVSSRCYLPSFYYNFKGFWVRFVTKLEKILHKNMLRGIFQVIPNPVKSALANHQNTYQMVAWKRLDGINVEEDVEEKMEPFITYILCGNINYHDLCGRLYLSSSDN